MRKAVEVNVTGLVQGVFFRAETRQQAERQGITGWVRNEPDGSVAAHFEGKEEAVEAMVDWCRRGPSRARVEHVELREVEPTGAAGFDAG